MTDFTKMEDEIKKCLEVLKQGGLILYPTDTIWGVGCDATNESAIEKIYKLKRREDSKSMIILLDSEGRLPSYLDSIPEQAWQLMEYTSKPLTLVLPCAKNLPKNIVASDKTIGIRITKDEFCRKLIERFRKPIVSTSANISGEPAPQNFSEINEEIKRGVDYVVDLRQSEVASNKPSSIIQIGLSGEFKIIRK